MTHLKKFEEFIERKIVKTITPDINRANSLIEESRNRLMFLRKMEEKIKITNETANYFIENAYDVIIELIRAKMLQKGYKSSGEGAHEAEVMYLQKLEINENDIRFMNDLRYFRNGIKYYGKKLEKEYAESVIEFMNKIIKRLE